MQEGTTSVGGFMDPEAIIKQLEVVPGSIAADFGCGPGYFSLPFAKVIGEEGKLYSLDVLPQALETTKSKAKISGLTNIFTERVNFEKEGGSHLNNESLDWVIMKDVLFQNQKKEIVINEAFRILKNGGKALFVEWNENESGIGPRKEVRVLENDLKKMATDAGFKIEKKIDAGNFHYAFVGVKG